ncbi:MULTISPECIES: phage head closure protein [unclassified Roseovarius]|uniref:phage head closure protein n=1 Tax=unclassified Roseovarius TaxID=2614913 RepID=UPI00273F88E8|nr:MULTISPECIES: phage head closure protein [unclassified Roseovarius]
MLKSGKLDRQITIERQTETVAASGAVSKVWATVATIRAELVQRSAKEFLTGYGEAETGSLVFRTRYHPGLNITTADRVTFDGDAYDIDETAILGRRRAQELRVVRKG